MSLRCQSVFLLFLVTSPCARHCSHCLYVLCFLIRSECCLTAKLDEAPPPPCKRRICIVEDDAASFAVSRFWLVFTWCGKYCDWQQSSVQLTQIFHVDITAVQGDSCAGLSAGLKRSSSQTTDV